MDNRRCRAAGEAGDHRVKAAPLALIPCANRCAGDGAFERGKPAVGIAGIAENPVGAPMPRRFAGEVARQAGGVTGRKGGKVGKVANLLPELFGEGGAAWRKWVAEIAQIARTLLAARGPQRLTGVGVAPILPHRKNGLKSRKDKAF